MDDETRRLVTEARSLFAAGDHDGAEKFLKPLARDKIPYADVYSMLGTIRYHRGRLDEARALFEEALVHNPGYVEAALHLAVTYNELGRYEEAQAISEKIQGGAREGSQQAASGQLDAFVSGKIANLHADVARAYEEAGRPEEAAREYSAALSLCPQFVDLRIRLGICLRICQKGDEAVAEFRKAKEQNAGLVAPCLQLGLTYYVLGRLAEAEVEWREVLAKEPENKLANLYLQAVKGESGGGQDGAGAGS